MSSVSTLHTRLKELSASLGRIHPLVSRLRNFTSAVGQGDEARLELGAEIHGLLKEAEEQLEILKVDVEALESGPEVRRKTLDNEKELERERVVASAGKLTEDLKTTRADFRNAQLQAKRNAELARRKERELLFARSQNAEKRTQSTDRLTQDEITVNASNDVTAALRRTHQLMQAELSRSQFAQETLEHSTAVLSSLSESYTDLDSLLSSSRSLIGSLLRSQKSDTWYLETAFYILVGTIAWLLFRRILYGPLWWLVWLPIKLAVRFVFALLGVVGVSNMALQPSPSVTPSDTLVQETPNLTPKVEPSVEAASEDAIWDQATATKDSAGDRMIDEIGEMVETSGNQEAIVNGVPLEETRTQDERSRNTKKRMYEATEVWQHRKDEL